MVSKIEQQIRDCIEVKESFILDAGAGSGKTWTLVQTLNYILDTYGVILKRNTQQTVCITYTNVAKNEILKRTEYNPLLTVNTIHDFLWDCIKPFQKELKEQLIILLENRKTGIEEALGQLSSRAKKGRERAEARISKIEEALTVLKNEHKKITYANFPNYKEGKFSHDDLIKLGEGIFNKYPKISKIISDSFPIILVDEYQDTQKEIVEILLNHLVIFPNQVIGFFGDKMQRIYDKGVGLIPEEYNLQLIQKTENYRSSASVITLLNKLRDDLQQVQAPNNDRTGEALFFQQPTTDTFLTTDFIDTHLKERWNLTSNHEVKVLYLTHRYIAKENQYEELLSLYTKAKKRDSLTDNPNNRGWEAIADYLFDAERLIQFYQNGEIQSLLKKSTYSLKSFKQKKELRSLLEYMSQERNNLKIGDFLHYISKNNILPITPKMEIAFEDESKINFYEELKNLDYSQFTRLFQVQEESTPFSTKHNTKGNEFDNVLVIIDDQAWTQKYNFDSFFSGTEEKEARQRNTNNLFYVVCSRAKNNLAVFCASKLSELAIDQLQEWFGDNLKII